MATANRQSAPRKPRAWADEETRPMDLMDEAPPLKLPVGEATELTGREARAAVIAAVDRARKGR